MKWDVIGREIVISQSDSSSGGPQFHAFSLLLFYALCCQMVAHELRIVFYWQLYTDPSEFTSDKKRDLSRPWPGLF